MKEKFKLTIYPGYENYLIRLLTLYACCFIIPMLLFGFLRGLGVLGKIGIHIFAITSIIFIIAMVIFFKRKYSFVDVITIDHDAIFSPKLGRIKHKDISKHKQNYVGNGYIGYLLTLKEGQEILLVPSSPWSLNAGKVFSKFITSFERSLKAFKTEVKH